MGSFFDVIVDHFLESFLGSFLVVQMRCSFISTFKVLEDILKMQAWLLLLLCGGELFLSCVGVVVQLDGSLC